MVVLTIFPTPPWKALAQPSVGNGVVPPPPTFLETAQYCRRPYVDPCSTVPLYHSPQTLTSNLNRGATRGDFHKLAVIVHFSLFLFCGGNKAFSILNTSTGLECVYTFRLNDFFHPIPPVYFIITTSVSFSKLLNKRFESDYQTAAYLHAPEGMASCVTFGQPSPSQMFRFGSRISCCFFPRPHN